MDQATFRTRYPRIPLGTEGTHHIEFSPQFKTQRCPFCSSIMRRAGLSVYDHETHAYRSLIGYACPRWDCQRRLRGMTSSSHVTGMPVSKVAIEYKRASHSYQDERGWPRYARETTLAKAVVPVGNESRIRVAVATMRALYLRGLRDVDSVRAGRLVCNMRKYAPIPVVREEYLGRIDAVFAGIGFQPYAPEGADLLRYNVYDFSEARIERYYRNEAGSVLELSVPAQSEEKIDSWFIIHGVIAIRCVRLYDEEGREYTFPITVRSPALEMRVYSFRDNVKVTIEEAIAQLDKRLRAEIAPAVSTAKEAAENAQRLLRDVAVAHKDRVRLTQWGDRVGYTVKGQENTYFAGLDPHRGLVVYKYPGGEYICIVDHKQGSKLAIHDRIVTRILALLRDRELKDKISTL